MTYQLEPHNFSVEQMRYLDRMRRASEKQNFVYRQNINKNSYMTEKEKYAKLLEADTHSVQLPINVRDNMMQQPGRRIPLGKQVTQMEMRHPETRQHLKEMLQYQIREKEL
jgi:hypothetical protein